MLAEYDAQDARQEREMTVESYTEQRGTPTLDVGSLAGAPR